MESLEHLNENAVAFVNLLTPGNFDTAKTWLSDSCEYRCQDNVLLGDEIIKSFSDNHENAVSKISIEYIDGKVKKVEGQTVFIGVQDRLLVGDKFHLYEDCLAITCNDQMGKGSIERIEHCPIKEEREKLSQFLKSVDVKL